MEDTYRHKGLRLRLCATLREKGITDERVLQAIERIPRHLFLDTALDKLAYEDRALPISCDQTISQPSTVALQTILLDLKEGMKVLEIGTGSGYQTAVLCELGAKVFTIERQKGLFDATKRRLEQLRYRAHCFLGDGYLGTTGKNYAPYDRVIITCGAPFIPEKVMEQLKPNGIMVIPVGEKQQEMMRITKLGDTPEEWKIERFGGCRFVPMLDGRQF